MTQIGLYGKLPAHGDFLHRNLPTRTINNLDAWLQSWVGGARERLGEHWLEHYLTAPVWRFALSAGALDHNAWAGVALPSVDRVGRYFPLALLAPLAEGASPAAFAAGGGKWYERVEQAALRALEGSITVEQMLESAGAPPPAPPPAPRRAAAEPGVVLHSPGPAALAVPALLEAFVLNSFPSYSIWATAGSDCVERCAVIVQGMPSSRNACALLDGRFAEWGLVDALTDAAPRADAALMQ